MEKKLLAHQWRMLSELEELRGRVSKLGAFILDNPMYSELEEEERVDMQAQYGGMCIYLDSLERRVNKFLD